MYFLLLIRACRQFLFIVFLFSIAVLLSSCDVHGTHVVDDVGVCGGVRVRVDQADSSRRGTTSQGGGGRDQGHSLQGRCTHGVHLK